MINIGINETMSLVDELCLKQVLSIETALSIQSHPDKSLAEQLHSQSPKVNFLSLQPLLMMDIVALQRQFNVAVIIVLI